MLTHQQLTKMLEYDPDTGHFTWLWHYKVNSRISGTRAGTIKSHGIMIKIAGIAYYAHNLAFFYINGKMPENQVKHINGNKFDNRFENLLLTNKPRIVMRNPVKTQYMIVEYDKQTKSWLSSICILGYWRRLERSSTKPSAIKLCDNEIAQVRQTLAVIYGRNWQIMTRNGLVKPYVKLLKETRPPVTFNPISSVQDR